MVSAAQHGKTFSSAILRTSLGLVFAGALAFAPQPAFAQHGSSGGGGGSHSSGGGGSHSNGGSSHTSTGSSHPSTGTGNSSGGHWWNPFHSNSAKSTSNSAGAGSSSSDGQHVWYGPSSHSAGTRSSGRFAANNYLWQDPPAPSTGTHSGSNGRVAGSSSAQGSAVARGTAIGKRPMPAGSTLHAETVAPPHIFRPRPPVVIIYDPFFPFGGFGFGFGSSFAFGNAFGCDPFWGCYGSFAPGCGPFWGCYGYGYAYGPGYSMNDSSGGNFGYSADIDAEGSQEANPHSWQNAPADHLQADDVAVQPYVVLFFRDGSSYAVSDYWLADGKLHYVTSYGGENSIDVNHLDLQRTVNENASRGIDFALRPAPATGQPQPAPRNSQPNSTQSAPQQQPLPNPAPIPVPQN
jgi:hypothetical protein